MITLVGVGPGSLGSMTLDALEAIKRADSVLAFSRVRETLLALRDDIEKIERLDDLKNCRRDDDVVIAVSGDPLFYGLAGTLLSRGVAIERVVPGLSSVQCASARLKIPWQDMAFYSFHGRERDVAPLLRTASSCVLLDKSYTASQLSKDLKEAGAKGTIHGISYLSYDEEKIDMKAIGETLSIDAELALAVIELELDA
ncbi:MAG: precorrin-6y C5,15-methyltransferase (decarboxylating) subunit CbiE [Peptoniphilus sp.]|nr:precorrin-6y C5,15-methyltransferase (decarboxylating) subunit CbiE [Peptoniphilus sp.]MDD7363718.1 precorrin-6y C5,15-methyltransferase (decarboxylating) subunit CbiE [Bacillota bacterium]MDY6044103.1 precorrin-6y C5,15-methyltransferase (decarboxylating) subunit CbiE [Peptoniphilus sp.]